MKPLSYAPDVLGVASNRIGYDDREVAYPGNLLIWDSPGQPRGQVVQGPSCLSEQAGERLNFGVVSHIGRYA